MPIAANGKTTVVTAGTPVPLVSPTNLRRHRWIAIQALAANTLNVYVGVKGMNKTTLAGVLAILAPSAPPFPIFVDSPSLNPEEIYIDGDTNGNSVISGGA